MTKLYLRVQTDLSPSCWSSSFSTCWCWCRLLPSALQHLQLGFLLVVCNPLQELLPQTVVVVCLWSWLQGRCLEYAGGCLFFSYDLHKQEMICLLVSLFVLFVSLFILFFPSGRIHFQIVMNSSEDGEQHPWFSLSLTIVCSVLFSGDSDFFFPFLSALSALLVVTLGHFSPEPPGRWQVVYLTLVGCA